MKLQVQWSESSIKDLGEIIEFVNENWGEKTALDYLIHIENIVEQIQVYPFVFPVINLELEIRKCVLSTHNSLYYRVNNSEIHILRIYSNVINPIKHKLK